MAQLCDKSLDTEIMITSSGQISSKFPSTFAVERVYWIIAL